MWGRGFREAKSEIAGRKTKMLVEEYLKEYRTSTGTKPCSENRLQRSRRTDITLTIGGLTVNDKSAVFCATQRKRFTEKTNNDFALIESVNDSQKMGSPG